MKIAGNIVQALRHGMAGQPGFELFGPVKDGDAVLAALVKAGEEFGLTSGRWRAIRRTRWSRAGFLPMPGIYSGDERMAKYRDGSADCFEGNASLGGSYYAKSIDDHYVTPHDLGYGFMIKFDHDFIGREALEKIANQPQRIKVTLELNDADVQKALASQYGKDGDRAKFIEFPSAVYSMYPQDKVLSKDGKPQVGVSTWMGYSSNERKQLTLAYLEPNPPSRHRSDVRLGRGRRRLEEAHRRVAQAGADPRDRLPGSVRGFGALGVRRGQLAREGQAV